MKTNFLYLAVFLFFINNLIAQDPQEGWDFEYPGDDFTKDALLDLSYLNEETAGENGFIRLSSDGEHFVNDQGEIRFWATGGGELIRNHDPNLTDKDLETYAKFLAKMGVNMIRYHGEMFSTAENLNTPNRAEATFIWRVVAAMKKEGIYTTISPFWPGHVETIPARWGLDDYVGDVMPWGLIYFDEKLQNAYKNWVEYLYSRINPYTGIALKDDPAVAIIQVINEDGVFFWTINGVLPSLKAMMQTQFYSWVAEKYGSIEGAFTAWENTSLGEDNLNQGLLEIINIWFATDDPNVPTPTTGFRKRLTDQMQFFAEIQRSFYQDICDHYRNIGCKQLINASNWRTASSSRLFDLERWTNLPGEVLAMNRYYDPGHIGPNSGWRIERLHHYQGESALFSPHELPVNIKQVVGKPFIITESGWNLPNQYQAEGPFLVSAFMSLSGVDAFFWFNPSSITYEDDPYWPYFGNVNGELPMYRWTSSIPGQVGMFPANALAFRKGYIQKGDPVVHEERTFESLIERALPIVAEENAFDPNRDVYIPNQQEGETELSPLTFLAGPVQVQYEGNPVNTNITSQLAELVNIPEKRLTSVTGQLVWDYNQGICVLDAPSAQGICGFPGDDSYELSDVIISTSNDYIVINVVSMDDLPLSSSEKVLVQVGTVYRPTGWQETPTVFTPGGEGPPVEGFQIQSLGMMPWKGSDVEVHLELKNDQVNTAWLLDVAGYKALELETFSRGNNLVLTLPSSTMYLILEKQGTTSTGESQLSNVELEIYPNPNDGSFLVKPARPGDIQRIEIFDLAGRKVELLGAVSNGEYNLGAVPGAYLVRVYFENGTSLVKQIFIH